MSKHNLKGFVILFNKISIFLELRYIFGYRGSLSKILYNADSGTNLVRDPKQSSYTATKLVIVSEHSVFIFVVVKVGF